MGSSIHTRDHPHDVIIHTHASLELTLPSTQSGLNDSKTHSLETGALVLGKGRTGMKAKLLSKRDGFQLLGHVSTGDTNVIQEIFTAKLTALPL